MRPHILKLLKAAGGLVLRTIVFCRLHRPSRYVDLFWTFRCRFIFILSLIAPYGAAARDSLPLHSRIDELVTESAASVAAPLVGDAEFLRRVSLDLIGIPPTVAELRPFLADRSSDKRVTTIDRLLNHPRYPRHMAEVFDVLFMERRPNQHVTADEWHQYLLKAFRENRPYNELAKEILNADGAEPNPRAAVRFYLDRQADPNLLTRDVGRIFLGRDMQCAQCHDHPLISDYHQADYHGLLAFFNSSAVFTASAPNDKTYYIEKAGTNVVFESVFFEGKRTTGPKLLGLTALEEPSLYPDELYVVKPADGVRPIPKFSRRAKLAGMATNGTNRAFNENIANRLWAHMMGRGLVEPVDLHHAGNPPSNPELLTLLGEEFAAGGFNVKLFWRELALTQTYQRSVDLPPEPASYASFAASLITELERRLQEIRAAAEQAGKQYAAAAKQSSNVEETALPLVLELEQVTASAAQTAASLDEVTQQLVAMQTLVAEKATVSQTLADAVAKTQEVVESLPEDQELLAAAQKMIERQQQVTAEIGTLRADAEQKAVAVNETQQALAKTRQSIDAVRAKFAPLSEQMKQCDQVFATTRQVCADRETACARLEERLSAVKQLAALLPLQRRIVAANSRVSVAKADVAAATAAVKSQPEGIAASSGETSEGQQRLSEAEKLVQEAQTDLEQHTNRLEESLASLQVEWTKTFAVRALKPLTPEQMYWSILHVTGVYDRTVAVKQAELDRTAAESGQEKNSPSKVDVGELELQQRAYDALKANVTLFVSLYAPAAGQPQSDFFATPNQALFAANGAEVNSWIAPAAGNLTERLVHQPDPEAAAEELYLTVLSRLPDEAEVTAVTQYLAARPDQKAACVQELVWGLLNSIEFRFNH